jgi:hypothetical protein
MRHIWTVLCSKVSIDRETNNASLFDIIEQMQLQVPVGTQKPITFGFSGDIVTLWGRDNFATPITGESRIRILGPSGIELGSFVSTVDLTAAPRNRVVGHLNGLRLEDTGWHEIESSFRQSATDAWTIIHKLPIQVTIVEGPAAADVV